MAEISLRTALFVVTRKELREIVRDKRSLFVLLLLPVVLYPLLFVGTMLAASSQMNRLSKKTHKVWVEDLDKVPGELAERLEEIKPLGKKRVFRVELSEPPKGADYDAALSDQRVAAVVKRIPELIKDEQVEVEVLYNGSFDTSGLIRSGIVSAVHEWRDELVAQRIESEQLSPKLLHPVVTKASDRGPPGALFGRMLSILVVVLALTSAFYPALDLGAGEKERGTLETILLAPVSRVTLAMGKVLAVFLIALASAALNLVSLALTFVSSARLAPSGMQELQMQFDPWLPPLMLLVLLPLVLLFSALSLALSTFAASYKEGQAYLTPVMALGTLPAMGAALPGIDITPTLSVVPVLGAVLLMKALLAKSAGFLDVILVLGSSTAYAGLGVRWVASLYNREEVLWRPAAASAPDLFGRGLVPRAMPTLPQAVAMACAALLLFWFVGVPAQARGLVSGLILTLVGLIAVPAIAYAVWLRCDLRETFSLRRPPALAWPSALLLAVGGLTLNLLVVYLQKGGAPPEPPDEALKALGEAFAKLGTGQLLLLVALLPAICEEVLCRGFLLAGFRSEGGTWSAVFVSAIVFAVLHFDPSRLLPTFFLGVIMAILVVRSGSIFPAMLLHFTNNALALGLGTKGLAWGFINEAEEPTTLLFAVGIPAFLAGMALLWGLKPLAQSEELPKDEDPSPSEQPGIADAQSAASPSAEAGDSPSAEAGDSPSASATDLPNPGADGPPPAA